MNPTRNTKCIQMCHSRAYQSSSCVNYKSMSFYKKNMMNKSISTSIYCHVVLRTRPVCDKQLQNFYDFRLLPLY